LLLGWPNAAWAGTGVRAVPGELWQAWNWDALVIFNLSLLLVVYYRGLARLWNKFGRGNVVSRASALAFIATIALLAVILLSPLDALSEELSSAHMVQHMLLMLVAAPLLVLGCPARVMPLGMPRGWRWWIDVRLLAPPALWKPAVAFGLFGLTLWGWHHPLLYQATLRDGLVHDAQHLSFFAASFVYWRVVLDPLSKRRVHAVAAVPYLFATSLHASLLGIFLALSPQPWYADFLGRTSAWGLTPHEDQQLAGLIMWVPACLVYPAIAALRVAAWLASAESLPATGRAAT
jgi:cytochrome c oxidase assembly factor CtaG